MFSKEKNEKYYFREYSPKNLQNIFLGSGEYYLKVDA